MKFIVFCMTILLSTSLANARQQQPANSSRIAKLEKVLLNSYVTVQDLNAPGGELVVSNSATHTVHHDGDVYAFEAYNFPMCDEQLFVQSAWELSVAGIPIDAVSTISLYDGTGQLVASNTCLAGLQPPRCTLNFESGLIDHPHFSGGACELSYRGTPKSYFTLEVDGSDGKTYRHYINAEAPVADYLKTIFR